VRALVNPSRVVVNRYDYFAYGATVDAIEKQRCGVKS
jgi:hypothetical protein